MGYQFFRRGGTTSPSQLILNPSQHQFIVNFVGEGQALIGEGVPLWGAGSKNLIFLLTHSRPHYLLTHSPAHPQYNHQPAHRLPIHLLLIASSPLSLFYPSAALWHDGRISTNWNEKVNFPQILSFHHDSKLRSSNPHTTH